MENLLNEINYDMKYAPIGYEQEFKDRITSEVKQSKQKIREMYATRSKTVKKRIVDYITTTYRGIRDECKTDIVKFHNGTKFDYFMKQGKNGINFYTKNNDLSRLIQKDNNFDRKFKKYINKCVLMCAGAGSYGSDIVYDKYHVSRGGTPAYLELYKYTYSNKADIEWTESFIASKYL